MAAWRASSAAACTALGLLLGAAADGIRPEPAAALELRGQTYFTNPPWKVDFTNYYWYVNQAQGEYYFTVTLAENAGAGLGGLVITQIRGVDRNFSLAPQRAHAFIGRPRREGAAVPVEATFDQATRTLRAVFPEPPQPGQEVTLALRPPLNPTWADTYVFAVPAPLGVARLEIMSRFW
jgi:hypothetical protein